jgi:hypothetical protein
MQAVGNRLSVQLVRLQYHRKVEIPTPLLLALFNGACRLVAGHPGFAWVTWVRFPSGSPINNIEVVYGKDVLALT